MRRRDADSRGDPSVDSEPERLVEAAAARAGDDGNFSGKESTPYGDGTVHDFMHAKVCVCDDTTFVGSFNLSRSGEKNAENVLEIEDAGIADRLATFVDEVRARYPRVTIAASGSGPPPAAAST